MIGNRVTDRHVGQRVILSLDAPAFNGIGQGTYQSHYLTTPDKTIPAPDEIPDELLGTLWLPYLTAWGCLIWKQQLQPGQIVLLPAASSSVAIAASQVVKHKGGISIGLTTRPGKVDKLQAMKEAQYDHLVVTGERKWWRDIRRLTQGKGADVIFDPIAAGEFLNHITERVAIPTIGIGSGKFTDGQVLIVNDILGITPRKLRLAEKYQDYRTLTLQAIEQYREEVEQTTFPSDDNVRHMATEELQKLLEWLPRN